jgi:hypothetical protein
MMEAEAPVVAEAVASDDEAPAPSQRMVVRTARLEVRTSALSEASAALTGLAEGVGGYVAEAESTGVGDDLSRVEATLRVPSSRFDDTLEQLRARGDVLREGVEGQDVTEQYSDLQAQLRSQKALEERMLTILARTEKVEDALAVEKELVRVRSTIETLEGRSKLLEHQVEMATIHVILVNPTQSNAPESETVASRLDRALDDAGDGFIAVVGALIRLLGVMLPLLLIGGPTAYAAHRGLRRRKARLAQAVAPRPPTR